MLPPQLEFFLHIKHCIACCVGGEFPHHYSIIISFKYFCIDKSLKDIQSGCTESNVWSQLYRFQQLMAFAAGQCVNTINDRMEVHVYYSVFLLHCQFSPIMYFITQLKYA